MKRQKRNQRRNAGALTLTDRDKALLKGLVRLRLAGTGELAMLFFPNASRNFASQRLRKLYDSNFLEAVVGDRSQSNRYRLGTKGRRWAESQGLEAKAAPRIGREHFAGIVHLWCTIARTVHSIPGWQLETFVPEWEIRESQQGLGCELVPDAMVSLVVPGPGGEHRSLHLAIELDLGTERKAEITRKIRAYGRAVGSDDLFDGQEFGLAFVLSGWSDSRREGLEAALMADWPGLWLAWNDGVSPAELGLILVRALEGVTTDSHYRCELSEVGSDCDIKPSGTVEEGLSHE